MFSWGSISPAVLHGRVGFVLRQEGHIVLKKKQFGNQICLRDITAEDHVHEPQQALETWASGRALPTIHYVV